MTSEAVEEAAGDSDQDADADADKDPDADTAAAASRPAPAARRFVLRSTPLQGHTVPLLALAERLVHDGHEVVFFTTAHYRDRVIATGAGFVPFDPAHDTYDLMVDNPARAVSTRRGVRGVKKDLREIFIGPIPDQFRELRGIVDGFAADCIVMDSMFLGALPYALGPRVERPTLACIGTMPYAAGSRDTAPFGTALQPGSGPVSRVRNRTLNWVTQHLGMADIQRFARRRLAEAGAAGFSGYFIDLQPKVVDAFFQACVAGFEYPRSDLAPTVHFVGPIFPEPTNAFVPPEWWDELRTRRRPVVHVTQGTVDNVDLGRLLLLTVDALRGDDVLVVATTGGPEPGPLRHGLPDNARLERFIPHDELLPYVEAVVTNGGYGGVQQALAHGIPLVVAGNSEDKPEVAARVQWSGTGINLHTGKPSKAMVARAVRRVLTHSSYRQRARALQGEIEVSDPLGEITRVLSGLCRGA